jgi:hypothetical protein
VNPEKRRKNTGKCWKIAKIAKIAKITGKISCRKFRPTFIYLSFLFSCDMVALGKVLEDMGENVEGKCRGKM